MRSNKSKCVVHFCSMSKSEFIFLVSLLTNQFKFESEKVLIIYYLTALRRERERERERERDREWEREKSRDISREYIYLRWHSALYLSLYRYIYRAHLSIEEEKRVETMKEMWYSLFLYMWNSCSEKIVNSLNTSEKLIFHFERHFIYML